MIMLDMEVISFALDSSANQSAATGSERANKNEIYSPAASNYLMNSSLIGLLCPPLLIWVTLAESSQNNMQCKEGLHT